MFTGIVQGTGQVAHAQTIDGILRLRLATPAGFTAKLERGASISVNGVCLTAVEFDNDGVTFDVIDESLRLTNLGQLNIGSAVNLERAARFGDEIGGHVLSGHIHSVATVVGIESTQANVAMQLAMAETWMPYIISKGYIAINGCSLTIGQVTGEHFWLHLIPETLEVTNLNVCQPGDLLNVEIDHQTMVIVQTIERVMATRQANA
ncbi:MAG: riboflavin synthase subunit alpha [Myxococcota bacterium]|nr:riboflavin synthase subunit alpha [Myxococcota bacterium]